MTGPPWNRALLVLSLAAFLALAVPQAAARLRDAARAQSAAERRAALGELLWVAVAVAVVLGLAALTILAPP